MLGLCWTVLVNEMKIIRYSDGDGEGQEVLAQRG